MVSFREEMELLRSYTPQGYPEERRMRRKAPISMDPMDGNETRSDNSRIVDCDWLESESCRIVVLGSSILAKIAIAIILLS